MITGPYARAANCWSRAKSVAPPTTTGIVWMTPMCGSCSIAAARRISVAPSMTLSASSTTKWAYGAPKRRTQSATLPALRSTLSTRCW